MNLIILFVQDTNLYKIQGSFCQLS